MINLSHFDSPIGTLTLAARGGALVGLWIEGQKHFLGSIKEDIACGDDVEALIQAKDWLDRYFGGGKPQISKLPLAPEGSAFAKSVWNILCEIPYGETTTYGSIASRVAKDMGLAKMSAQAVGGAVGHNPISIIIPCHRVVGSNGSLTGYAGGIDKKIWLLTHEGLDMARLTVPTKGTAIWKGAGMSKYSALWEYVKNKGDVSFTLTFDEIKNVCGIPIDHSFLNSKKELEAYGYKVGKISLKNRAVAFERINKCI